jgi:hypothetical protein
MYLTFVMKKLITSICCFSALAFSSQAEIRVYQGSVRLKTTFFEPSVRTASGSNNYTTYYIVQTDSSGNILDAKKIEALNTRSTGKRYNVDNSFQFDYGDFNFNRDIAGKMEYSGYDVKIPFRGKYSGLDLGAFAIYGTSEFDLVGSAVDITEFSGSARLNKFFSDPVSSVTADDVKNDILDFLFARGYTAF